MHPEHPPEPLDWPTLSDETALALHDLIVALVISFESRYFAQIHRRFQHRAHEAHAQPGFIQPDLFASLDPNEPPF